MAADRHRIGYCAAHLLTAFPETFGRREHESTVQHVQRLAVHSWLMDGTDAELAAIADCSADLVAEVRDRMAQRVGAARLVRLAREARYRVERAHLEATGEVKTWPAEMAILEEALAEWADRRVDEIRSAAMERMDTSGEAA